MEANPTSDQDEWEEDDSIGDSEDSFGDYGEEEEARPWEYTNKAGKKHDYSKYADLSDSFEKNMDKHGGMPRLAGITIYKGDSCKFACIYEYPDGH